MKYLLSILFVAFGCVPAFNAIAIENHNVRILSPKDGSVISAGSSVILFIETGRPDVEAVLVTGSLPGLPETAERTQNGYQLLLTVPIGTDFSSHKLRAIARLKDGTTIKSTPISISVQRQTDVGRLTGPFKNMNFWFIGESRQFLVKAWLPDGSFALPSEAGLLRCTTDNNAVARWNARCDRVLATGVGRATLAAEYQGQTTSVAVNVAKAVQGDLNGDNRVDRFDLLELNAVVGSSVTVGGDARDINGDGRIDKKDLTMLRALCKDACR